MKKSLFSIFLAFILVFSVFTVYATESGIVNCNILNVRVSPDLSSEIVTQLPYGSNVEIIYTDMGWYNIKMENETTGFVFAPYITKLTPGFLSSYSQNVASNVASDAHNYIGCRYVYGSSGPSTFDCSGFTSYLYKQYGISLPRTSTEQGNFGSFVDKSALISGDIVCFSNRSDKKINHVGIYVGDGNFIHASTSTRGVVIDSLYEKYYLNNYISARRVL